jgi:hypothetical protein
MPALRAKKNAPGEEPGALLLGFGGNGRFVADPPEGEVF